MSCSCLSFCGFEKKEKQKTKITEQRSCTDVLFLLLFIFGWVIVFYIFSQARLHGGDPNKIVRGVDMYGRICGKDPGVIDKPLAAWPCPLSYDPKICVASCKETSNANNTQMAWLYSSAKLTYYCLPTFGLQGSSVNVTVQGEFLSSFESKSRMVARAVGDLFTSWDLILLSAFISLGVSYVFTFFLRHCAGCVVWICIILLVVTGIIIGTTLIAASQKQLDGGGSTGNNRATMLKYGGYVAFGLTGLFLLVIFFLRKDIAVATELVKEAARCILDIKALILFPLLPFALAVSYFVFWIIVSLYVFSVSSLQPEPTPSTVLYKTYGYPDDVVLNMTQTTNPTQMQRFNTDDGYRPLAAALFFHLLWNVNFQFYFGFTVLAGAVANWYFSKVDHKGNKIRGDSEHNELPWDPVFRSLKRTLRFHIGTIALASFLIAAIQFARACVKYLQQKAGGSRHGVRSCMQRLFFCILNCCLGCLECCIDKISKNALIWTAIWGDNFFTASCSSFVLLWRNLFKVAALNAVSGVLMFLGKLTVGLITMAIAVYCMTHVPRFGDDIYSPVVPALVVFLLAYVVADMFMLVFEVAIDTTLLCFLVDCEHNKDNAETMFASKGLQEIVGKHQKESQDLASDMNDTRSSKIKAKDVAAPEDFGENGQYLGQQDANGEPVYTGQPIELNRYEQDGQPK